MVKFDEHYTVASVKLWEGREWLWHALPIRATGQRHLRGTLKSPALIVRQGRCYLSVPIEQRPGQLPDVGRVCAVDVGINTLATASSVTPNGTVVARRFMHPAADIDRRNKRSQLIRRKARKTATLSPGFCKGSIAKYVTSTSRSHSPPRKRWWRSCLTRALM